MNTNSHEHGHGHSPAAWIAVSIMLISISVGTVAFFLNDVTTVIVSSVATVLGLVTGWVLAKLGYGVKGPKFVPKGH